MSKGEKLLLIGCVMPLWLTLAGIALVYAQAPQNHIVTFSKMCKGGEQENIQFDLKAGKPEGTLTGDLPENQPKRRLFVTIDDECLKGSNLTGSFVFGPDSEYQGRVTAGFTVAGKGDVKVTFKLKWFWVEKNPDGE